MTKEATELQSLQSMTMSSVFAHFVLGNDIKKIARHSDKHLSVINAVLHNTKKRISWIVIALTQLNFYRAILAPFSIKLIITKSATSPLGTVVFV